MDLLKDRRVLIAAGAAVAVIAGVAIAWGLSRGHAEDSAAPPASEAGLIIDSTADAPGKLDPAKPLRCFVSGKFVGDLTLADCAQRNGVATDALDVGVDENGDLAAMDQAGQALTPLPPEGEGASTAPVAAATPNVVVNAPAGACWRYADNKWSKLPTEMALNACVQTLFAGKCEQKGSATYGRWMQQTLRAVPGRIEISADNRSFRPLVVQGADCTIPPIG